jgi:SAM-dependent methyltransferase
MELASALASACAETGHALDVGCGTGQLSVYLASHFDRVTATDPSKTQIANAKPHPRVKYAVEAAERIGLPNTSADLIVATQAAHWFDLGAFYREAGRVARPGAVLALVSYGIPEMDGKAGERLHRFYWEDIHRFWPEGRNHVESGYKELPFPFAERSLPPLWITRSWVLSDLLGYVETWSAVKRARTAGEGTTIESFSRDLCAVWSGSDESRAIRWPLSARIATLR